MQRNSDKRNIFFCQKNISENKYVLRRPLWTQNTDVIIELT